MIRVTVWNEFVQEQMDEKRFPCMKDWKLDEQALASISANARRIRQVHGGAIHNTLRCVFEEDGQIEVRHVGTLEMEQCGLSEDVLRDTDVLVWWSHVAQQDVPDEVAARVASHVQRGMGVMFLHSAHMCKPMNRLLGTSCTLRWREGDTENLWCCNPTHPIAEGVPACIHLEKEEMYGEFFDIPTPDELVFLAGFGGGEVFRAGCVWNRGYGRVFYFQPGHETNESYLNPDIRRILCNAVHYLARPEYRREKLECLPV